MMGQSPAVYNIINHQLLLTHTSSSTRITKSDTTLEEELNYFIILFKTKGPEAANLDHWTIIAPASWCMNMRWGVHRERWNQRRLMEWPGEFSVISSAPANCTPTGRGLLQDHKLVIVSVLHPTFLKLATTVLLPKKHCQQSTDSCPDTRSH